MEEDEKERKENSRKWQKESTKIKKGKEKNNNIALLEFMGKHVRKILQKYQVTFLTKNYIHL